MNSQMSSAMSAQDPDTAPIEPLRDPYLLTPGPLTTDPSVKAAMLRDWGSWDSDFSEMTAGMRRSLLAMAGDGAGDYDCVPLQGSGTYCVEAMLASFVPRKGKALVLANGAYGLRAAEILRYLGRAAALIDKGDYLPPRGDEVAAALRADPAISHVVVIHCETSSGILNPIAEIAEAVHAAGKKLLIDSMSGFGALPLNVGTLPFTAMVSSANKCIEGVPGFGFLIAQKQELEAAAGQSHSLSLDVHAQWTYMNRTGLWRFTPPTHVVAGFIRALEMHAEEGGQPGRLARYTRNRDTLVVGMKRIGLETLLPDRWQSPIIVTFFNPADPAFRFGTFYDRMKDRGFVIYPGKLTVVDSFRIGCIGRIDHRIMERVVAATRDSLDEMGVVSASPPPEALAERARLTALDQHAAVN